MSIVLRMATLEDAEGLASLHAASFAEGWDADSFSRLLQRPGCFARIAGEGSACAAFILVQLAGGEAEIQSLATAEEARRRGYAHALLKDAARVALARGADVMVLEVASDNGAALSLYKGLGFREAGKRRAYYPRPQGQPPADALILKAPLPLS